MGRTACTEPQCVYKGALYLYLYLVSSVSVSYVLQTSEVSDADIQNLSLLYAENKDTMHLQ
jgi:hypothetical protein